MTFGDRLREARLHNGLTQEQLAQRIGVAKSTLTGYEKGNREPDVFKIKRILEVLGVDSDYLLGVSREKGRDKESAELLAQYMQLDEKFKKVIDNLIVQFLEIQSGEKQ